MLSSKNKIFQSIIKSIRPDKDRESNAEFVQTMADLNAKFSRITQECQQWDTVIEARFYYKDTVYTSKSVTAIGITLRLLILNGTILTIVFVIPSEL